jgi:N-methylhydantoinase A
MVGQAPVERRDSQRSRVLINMSSETQNGAKAPAYTIAVDTGGTFTDLVLAGEEAVLGLYKAPTTPSNLFDGIEAALRVAAEAQGLTIEQLVGAVREFVYSTTHSTNAILEGRAAKTAFLTTRGHPDILLYKEGGKDQAANWAIPFPKPYVPRHLTFEITERILADGSVAVPLNEDEVRSVLARLGELEIEAIGVALLWAPLCPDHELRIAELIEEVLPGVAYSLGHQVNRIVREYRRASATVIDASLKPLMRGHLGDIEARLKALGFRGEPLMVTHVSGGVLHLDQMVQRPLETVDSGPALAPIAGTVFARAEPDVFREDVLVVDTGGTSFDVSLVLDGRVAYTRDKWLGPRWYGDMTGLPAVDTRSVGAGGGSIASVDAGGLMQVGPASAGSDPGPVVYGLGGREPTVTDAAAVLGYLNPDNFLSGRMRLDVEAARNVIRERLAEPLGLTVEEAAEAVLVVASEQMRGLVVDCTVSQGRDARECMMVAGGGAAGINIVRIAREIGLREIIIPKLAAGLSAVGGVYTDIAASFSRGHHTLSSQFDHAGVNAVLREIDDEIDGFLDEVGHLGEKRRSFRCEARYDRQMWEIEVQLGSRRTFDRAQDVAELQAAFDENHLKVFAVNQPGEQIEIISWIGEARVVRAKPALQPNGHAANGNGAVVVPTPSKRRAYFAGEAGDVDVHRGDQLPIAAQVQGPAIIEEATTTIVLEPGSTAQVRDSHYLITIEQPAPAAPV